MNIPQVWNIIALEANEENPAMISIVGNVVLPLVPFVAQDLISQAETLKLFEHFHTVMVVDRPATEVGQKALDWWLSLSSKDKLASIVEDYKFSPDYEETNNEG